MLSMKSVVTLMETEESRQVLEVLTVLSRPALLPSFLPAADFAEVLLSSKYLSSFLEPLFFAGRVHTLSLDKLSVLPCCPAVRSRGICPERIFFRAWVLGFREKAWGLDECRGACLCAWLSDSVDFSKVKVLRGSDLLMIMYSMHGLPLEKLQSVRADTVDLSVNMDLLSILSPVVTPGMFSQAETVRLELESSCFDELPFFSGLKLLSEAERVLRLELALFSEEIQGFPLSVLHFMKTWSSSAQLEELTLLGPCSLVRVEDEEPMDRFFEELHELLGNLPKLKTMAFKNVSLDSFLSCGIQSIALDLQRTEPDTCIPTDENLPVELTTVQIVWLENYRDVLLIPDFPELPEVRVPSVSSGTCADSDDGLRPLVEGGKAQLEVFYDSNLEGDSEWERAFEIALVAIVMHTVLTMAAAVIHELIPLLCFPSCSFPETPAVEGLRDGPEEEDEEDITGVSICVPPCPPPSLSPLQWKGGFTICACMEEALQRSVPEECGFGLLALRLLEKAREKIGCSVERVGFVLGFPALGPGLESAEVEAFLLRNLNFLRRALPGCSFTFSFEDDEQRRRGEFLFS